MAIERSRHAGRNCETTSGGRQEGRQIAFHASRRIRSRGNSSRARGKARCSLSAAGDCHRSVESAARGREAASAKAAGSRKAASPAGPSEGPFRTQARVRQKIAGNLGSAAKRAAQLGVAFGAGPAGASGRTQARQQFAASRSHESRPYEGQSRASARRAESGAHAAAASSGRLAESSRCWCQRARSTLHRDK